MTTMPILNESQFEQNNPSGIQDKRKDIMGIVTSIASQKGGTSKTTTSISLAACVARKGHRTLLIDIDSQANSSKVLLKDYSNLKRRETLFTTILDKNPLPVHPTNVPNLEIVPSHILLSNTDV